MEYQEQIAGIRESTGEFLIEYRVRGPRGDVDFDGMVERPNRDPSRVFLEAKRGYEILHHNPHSKLAKEIAEGPEEEAERQIAAAEARGAAIEWHVSTPEGATAIGALLEDKDLFDIQVIYTPER
ncbi:hypothetical protein I6B53_01885 [Schaalia sp. 19OD2882]|uniref:Tox-REase-5 domain-containing protein n=1 Tax=Schaalia sp. 19OD2882 TaxID=2794089 RepID=UPI001C1EDF0E|nr:Tox-REase-5 domain-containing protein [Schaalia sp. 19OD2882]QWW19899.1 hypothetical protein I6B53_01885 [Schaalia sp. 19OD2882]